MQWTREALQWRDVEDGQAYWRASATDGLQFGAAVR